MSNATADARYRLDLKWWFETETQSAIGGGAINASVAVSINRLKAGNFSQPATTDQVEKGVYFTSAAGRAYCVDWTGPVSKEVVAAASATSAATGHDISYNWNGTAPTSPEPAASGVASPALNVLPGGDVHLAYATAANLNDNYRFHNDRSAQALARADNTYGKVRPRWVYPSQYVDTQGTGYQTAPDKSVIFPTANLTREVVTSPIYSAPSLIDFPWTNPADNTTVFRHLVAIAANDGVTGGTTTPTSGKVYLLDQAGDRNDFLTNPAKTPGGLAYSSPLDQYAVQNEALGNATPAWTYRMQYGTYDAAGNLITQDLANPGASLNHGTVRLGYTSDANGVADFNAIAQSQPSRRILPTLFFGTVGRMYAIDFDLATGYFTRWRPQISHPSPSISR